jgi:hypothetical protein
VLNANGYASLFTSIINDYYKVIYYVTGDTLRIAAFWDMRMNPEKLKKTI